MLAALLLLLAPVGLAGPALARTQAQVGGRGPLVLAAASLQEALTAAADSWARKGHSRPVLSFAASSALARQIEAKAPADLFVSADEEWMDFLAARKLLVPGSRADFLTNRLVIVAPAASRAGFAMRPGFPLASALGGGRLAVADPDSVPAGRYAREALTNLKVWQTVQMSLARAENVRAALALVARGAAPLGIVYATDARAEPAVRVAGWIPAEAHRPITYPLARLTTSSHPDAEAFRRFLLSGEGKAVFRRFGFGTR
ncbi:molybdenum ABC transporter substrate-binding protein [Novosphingobium fuchskuhlense]|uniref:Molybdenum ABC transporter substrate-binding protein n=2 Tax=Novosphingobium fuchskuhlense TaxID=1117702 RepID=A0A117UTN2_9SPHN|nr:molybdenum ABC transporter substrate-binding protein [Novosphingobium fuchskuhlense]